MAIPDKISPERACVQTPDNRFVVAYWEDLVAAVPSIGDHPDSGLLGNWAQNKSELLGKPVRVLVFSSVGSKSFRTPAVCWTSSEHKAGNRIRKTRFLARS
ncbi:MAG TPA: hypothetical protein VH350_06185 [Candidatus Sulfotelmatobacter sp.]|jgi:hypothetical protein|nr:hypothetical protein [Candidatus Sulfotelmatobacter sp.]